MHCGGRWGVLISSDVGGDWVEGGEAVRRVVLPTQRRQAMPSNCSLLWKGGFLVFPTSEALVVREELARDNKVKKCRVSLIRP